MEPSAASRLPYQKYNDVPLSLQVNAPLPLSVHEVVSPFPNNDPKTFDAHSRFLAVRARLYLFYF